MMHVPSSTRGRKTARNKVKSDLKASGLTYGKSGPPSNGVFKGGNSGIGRGSKTLENQAVAVWIVITPQATAEGDLPATLDLTAFVTSNQVSGPLDTWSLVTPPTGFTVDQDGLATAEVGTAIAMHSITASVFNDVGEAISVAFLWDVTA